MHGINMYIEVLVPYTRGIDRLKISEELRNQKIYPTHLLDMNNL